MADSAKRVKIAAARKKLKQFQKTSKGNKPRASAASPKPKTQNSYNTNNIAVNNIQVNSFGSDSLHNITEQESVINSTSVSASVEETYDQEPETSVKHLEEREPVQEVFVDENKDNRLSPVTEKANCVAVTDTQYFNNTAKGSHNLDFGQTEIVPEASYSFHLDTEMTTSPTASTESLQQLSRQINGILAKSPVGFEAEQSQSDIADLETRNRELAALLAQHAQANEQLATQNEQIRQHAVGIQSQLENERSETQQRVTKEIGPLKEQLQVHIQTIGILVAEKTEAQSQLSQSHKITEQRFGEVEDLSGRLKTSRQRVADLERSLSTSTNSSQKLEQTSKESAKEIDRLKLELYKVNKSQEDVKQTSSEVQEKLKSKLSECSGLQYSVDDLKRRLEMAELNNQQLSNQNEAGTETLQIVNQLQRERDTYATQIQQYVEAFQTISVEKDQLTEQYKQYMEQLHNQNNQLTSQITSLTEERQTLVTQNHDTEAAVYELQRKLEDLSSQAPAVDETTLEELRQEVMKLQSEYTDLSSRHEAQIRDNSQLSRLLEEKESALNESEMRLDDLGDLAGDKAELLENIQSDKTALSRALMQNKDLKVQLAELQNGFVKMSNDNMEMLTQLQTEQHGNRDLQTKVADQEDEVKDIREMLSQKDVELLAAQQNSVEANKARLLHEQIQDRLRHYEAQAQLVETLQKELHSSTDMVDALTTQNSELRSMLIRATETKALNPDSTVENAQRENVIDSLQATIQQMESERNQLMTSLSKQREVSDILGVKVSDLQEEVLQNSASTTENDKVPRKEHDKLKYALDMIQDKYMRVMRDKADLSDKADELEHLVLQLQGETDTIGEYISLYHHQRALLQQRELQKNDYIKQLAKDREELQDKLGELQTLVMQLMGEKNMLQSYQLECERPVSPSIHPAVPVKASTKLDDWPDYTSSESDTESEVETIVGGKDDVNPHDDPEHVAMDSSPITTDTDHTHNSYTNDINNSRLQSDSHIHSDSQRSRTHSKSQEEEEFTAVKILNLITEIGQSNLVDSVSFMEKQFHPCKYCKGRLQIL